MTQNQALTKPTNRAVTGMSQTLRYGFLLAPDFTLIALSAALEPLRMANRISGGNLYEFPLFSLSGDPVQSSSGIVVHPTTVLNGDEPLDAVFLCAGTSLDPAWDRLILDQIRPLLRRRITIGGICTGSYLLARNGLLNGYRCTVHWENISCMHDEFPDLIVSSELFELDKDRYTCSGGTAPMDMMLTLISADRGHELATAISEQFICERIRGTNDRQRIPLKHRFGASQPKLVNAVELMESNIEEPMSLDELARHIGISRRQLERIFQKHLNCVPTRYYLEIRLRRARELLLRSPRSIVDVAFSCGFVSAPHFSKCYRDFFGIPPREARQPRGVSVIKENNTEVPVSTDR